MLDDTPSDAPPSYAQATGSGNNAVPSSAAAQATSSSQKLDPSDSKNDKPTQQRRNTEDQTQPLPNGWVRTFDPQNSHHFFVDTTKDPPRSTWVHPYDDDEYLRSLSSEERERIEQESMWHKQSTKTDMKAEHNEQDIDGHHNPSATAGPSTANPELPPRPDGTDKGKGRAFGRRLKDKLTGTTHEQREVERKQRAEEEQRYYEEHMRFRDATIRATQTGQPQWLGKDPQGRDVYVEPPRHNTGYGYGGGYPGGYGPGYGGGYGGGGYMYNPYGVGVHSTPHARYIQPPAQYGRSQGSGLGGGYGLPLAVGGGLLGGLLLGDLLF